jgi:preprotein translocase subunit SecF
MTAGQLRPVVDAVVPGTEISQFGGAQDFVIRAPEFASGGAQAGDLIKRALAQKFGAAAFTAGKTEAVSGKVGGELQSKALLAILASFAATLIYLAFRFEWRYGVAATLATAHDLIFVLGFIAAFRIDVSLTTVAAVLTIVGYSLNDTVIIFDRIRENVRKAGKREGFIEILDRSINETLPRTVLTVTTTLLTLYSLFFLGGEILRSFAEILIVGIMVGTYSSIFVASPLLYEINKRWPVQKKPGQRARPGALPAGV